MTRGLDLHQGQEAEHFGILGHQTASMRPMDFRPASFRLLPLREELKTRGTGSDMLPSQPTTPMDKRELLLLIFPLLQSASFAAGCLLIDEAPFGAALLVVVAAVCLSFSLHITYHYHVHFKRRSRTANRVIDLAITALTGLPFHYYQVLHWNHHAYDNTIGDFTSTWRQVDGRPVAKSLFSYAFLWPFRRDAPIRDQLTIASREGYLKRCHRLPLAIESIVIVCIYVAMICLDISLAVAYLSMVYVGWTLIAMHNYGQHLPEVYGETKGNSYYGKLYNLLTVYNGLHYEHHHRPSVKYWQLNAPVAHSEIQRPHLLAGLLFSLRRRHSEPRLRS
jgi:fatty acid desaturase